MSDGYSLPPKKARTSRRVGGLFLLIGALMAVFTVAGSVVPGSYFNCDAEQRCISGTDPANLLPDEVHAELDRAPQARRHFDRWVAEPAVRVGLGALVLLELGPMTILLIAVGMTLRRLGRQQRDALAHALPWLRHASRAAIALALSRLVVPLANGALLYNGLGRPDIVLPPINLANTLVLLLFTAAVRAMIWALEAGIRAERELADFV
ncbi:MULTISPECIES: hypothetical protein [unclassified Sphingomonas]|uniref:hypothetical protein n=1 Tax=unclassified Sphingomonas TaxID=196159 RepID=UPI0006FB4888|nr:MULTISPECIES: hypothetical protein [unclassified Sphingomonas]KQM61487.1 hypothetical protein ASE65_08145 [Sphingomonas sp. Leaf16]KQN12582.1 hypothetical protein ASE81_09155 [Sphingomonas sp. Leaf29]KQN19062.1 hypothetical protein ASE83_09080 [Sphingomonas sp. Leaf32]